MQNTETGSYSRDVVLGLETTVQSIALNYIFTSVIGYHAACSCDAIKRKEFLFLNGITIHLLN